MQLDQIVEQLAFGRARPKAARSLGLYLSPEVVYLAETHLNQEGRLAVDHLVRIPIPTEGKKAGATATMSSAVSAPTPAANAMSKRYSRSSRRGGKAGTSSARSAMASGYSTTVLNKTGAQALNRPPRTPPNEIQR